MVEEYQPQRSAQGAHQGDLAELSEHGQRELNSQRKPESVPDYLQKNESLRKHYYYPLEAKRPVFLPLLGLFFDFPF